MTRVLLILCLVFASIPATAKGMFDGHWAGLWRAGGEPANATALTIRNDVAVAYSWDGRPVKVTSSAADGDQLILKGPFLHVILTTADKNTISAVSIDQSWRATFSRTHRNPRQRPAVFFEDYFGEKVPKLRKANPQLSSMYLEKRCCFGQHPREGKHAGIDFNAPRFTSAVATADGRVSRFYSAYNTFGCGNGISISHGNGLFSSYCHLEAVADLKVGSVVKRGQVVGLVGSTGISPRDMPHVHFELTKDGDPHTDGDVGATIDGAPYFKGCFGAKDLPETGFFLTYPVACKNAAYKIKEHWSQ